MEENKNLEIQKTKKTKTSWVGWLGLGLIIVSIGMLNMIVGDTETIHDFLYCDMGSCILGFLFLILLFLGIILFLIKGKGIKMKIITILVILPFILRVTGGVGFPTVQIPLFNIQAEGISKEALSTKNAGKCFGIGKFSLISYLISYFLVPPAVELSVERLRARCVTGVAVAEKDASFCDVLSPEKFINIEHDMPEGRSAEYRSDCYKEAFLVSEKYKDDLIKCKKEISGRIYLDDDCVENIAIQRNDLEICKAGYLSGCLKKLAFEKNDTRICEMIKDEFFLKECLTELALKTKNLEICNIIKEIYYRDDCINRVKGITY